MHAQGRGSRFSPKTKRGTTYKARLPRNYPGEKSKTFRRKADAEAWQNKMLAQIDRANALGMTIRPDVTLADFSQEWLSDKVLPIKAPSTIESWRH